MLFSDNSQARIQFRPLVERTVTGCLRMSHLSQWPGQTIWIMEQSHFVCVTHPAVSPLRQACRNMKNSFNAALRDERPENGRLAPPEWAEIPLADRQNPSQNK